MDLETFLRRSGIGWRSSRWCPETTTEAATQSATKATSAKCVEHVLHSRRIERRERVRSIGVL